MRLCSWDAGWRSLLLRGYEDRPCVDDLTTAATPDHLFVLVVDGSCHIESWIDGRWEAAQYRAVIASVPAPGRASTLRWRSEEPHHTLQLHLPRALLARQAVEIWDRDRGIPELPHLLSTHDPVVESMMLALRDGLAQGLPELYAETSAEFLGAHLLLRHCNVTPLADAARDDRRLRRAERYLHDNLGESISLATLSKEAGLSRFHLLRLFKRAYGETPLKRLTRLRMDEGKRRLLKTRQSIAEIALECGYENPANFATVFRRFEGVTPTEYRQPK